ncbi:hypothetical protein [Flavobacterium sp. IMCC34518]|uniref:hypothetical protein n=1 Tax=Flavobacterium sp. IMCC34518 TaxID=3003623 RepID=UPI0022AC133B|nr:hypothetical protein [Flavobacterium sp. IMCC34518]
MASLLIVVYDPNVSRKKMLADLDYLESRTAEENAKGLDIFISPPLFSTSGTKKGIFNT